MTEPEHYQTIEEIADRLQVSDQTIRRWIKSGSLPAYKPGREWRIRTEDLEKFLEARSSPKAPAPSSLEPTLWNGMLEGERRLYVAAWIATLDRCAEALEHLSARDDADLDTLADAAVWSLEFWFTYRLTVQKQARQWASEVGRSAHLETAEARMRKAQRTIGSTLEESLSKADAEKVIDIRDRLNKAREEVERGTGTGA